jgi:hypothetical protein
MKTTDIGFERFEEDFYADPKTMFIKPDRTKDTRTPYEQYVAGEKIIYVDLSDINEIWNPELMTREEYCHRFIAPPAISTNFYSAKNFKIDINRVLNEE